MTEDKKLKQLYNELAELRRFIEDLWESVPIPLCSTNPVLNILETGEIFKHVFGFKEDEIIGENLDRIFMSKQDYENIKQKIATDKKIEAEEGILVTKTGKEILSTIYAKPKTNQKGEIIGYIFSFLDVSEKKKVQIELQNKVKDLQRFAKELKSSRAALLNILEDIEEARGVSETERDKTLAIIENFPEALMFFDQDNRLSSINPKVKEFFSVTSEQLIGRDYARLVGITSLVPIMKILGEDIKKVFKQEIKIKEDLVLEISTIRIRKGEEKIGTLVVLRDTTREKVIERLKTEFVSIAAHQLRTPLSAIKWTLRMILDGDIGDISGEQKEFLDKTYNSNERMIRLINDLLNVTRIEEGRFLYKVMSQDLVEIVEKVASPSKDNAKRKGLIFELNKPEGRIPKVDIDAEKISIVIQNLVDNAIHYTNKGGTVSISIEHNKPRKEIMVSIKDTGIGIPEEQQKRVFSRFFRAANAVRAETEGTGLGLYIAKNVIEAHNGRIWFESEQGQGTTFFFTIPIAK